MKSTFVLSNEAKFIEEKEKENIFRNKSFTNKLKSKSFEMPLKQNNFKENSDSSENSKLIEFK